MKLFGRLNRLFHRLVVSKLSSHYRLNHGNGGSVNFIDVGSIGGLPAPWDRHADQIRFLLNFEPNGRHSRTANSLTYDKALWHERCSRPFYIYKGFRNTGSSLFKQNLSFVEANYGDLSQCGRPDLAETWFDRSQLVRVETVACETLDEILASTLPEIPFHFMKIDAQGAELNILKGAKQLLAGPCVGLHLELFTLPLYQGIALLDEVSRFLSAYGFHLAKKFPAHGSFASQHDCLFLKQSAPSGVLTQIGKIYALPSIDLA
jgi:FkbM family methyltransferase